MGAIALAGLLIALGSQLSISGPALAKAKFSFTRIAGSDRYATAALTAEAAFPGGVKAAILADGQLAHFPDALSASYLAGYFNVPVLLTDPGSLPSSVLQALSALHVQSVAVIGGTAAISDNVVAQITANGMQANRVGGATRYDTDQAVDTIPPASYVGKPGTPGLLPTAVVASGTNFPDALVSGPLAFASHLPIVITDPTNLSPQAQATLQGLGIKQVLIAGGTAAVSANVEAQLNTNGMVTKRFAGTDRTDTAAQIATYAVQNLGFTNAAVGLARGDDPADSLAAGPFEGLYKTPTLLTNNPTAISSFSLNFLKTAAPTLTNGVIFGGTAAVSDAVKAQAEAAAQTVVGNLVTVTAAPASLVAGQATTSAVTATVKDATGNPVANDPVTFSTTGAPAAACGPLAPPTGLTNAAGVATATYTSATVGGSCVISAAEQSGGGSAQVAIQETSSTGVTVSVSVSPQSLSTGQSAQVVATVSDKNGAPVANDPVAFTVAGAGCTPTVVPAAAVTDSHGSEAGTFVAATVPAVCTISATEAQGQASGSAEVAQIGAASTTTTSLPISTTTSLTLPTSTTTSLTVPVSTTSTTLGGGGSQTKAVAIGASPTTINKLGSLSGPLSATITVTVTIGGSPVVGDTITFGLSGASCPAALAPGVTGSGGQMTAVYAATTTSGSCTITAHDGTFSGSTSVTTS